MNVKRGLPCVKLNVENIQNSSESLNGSMSYNIPGFLWKWHEAEKGSCVQRKTCNILQTWDQSSLLLPQQEDSPSPAAQPSPCGGKTLLISRLRASLHPHQHSAVTTRRPRPGNYAQRFGFYSFIRLESMRDACHYCLLFKC